MTDSTAALTDPPAASAPDAPSPFRWRLEHRPDVRFGHAAGGVGGILVAAAAVAFVVATTGDDPTLPGVAFTAGLVVVALLAGWRVRGPVRSAAVAAIAVSVPLVWAFAVLGDSEGGRGDFRLVLLLTIATYVVLYLASWTRGRAVLLGLVLLFAASWIVFEVADQDVPFAVDVAGRAQTGVVDGPDELLGSDRSAETAGADLAVAVALLGAAVVLDRRGKAGAATPFLLVGGLYAVNAAVAWGIEADDVYATGVFLAIAGFAIGLAGSLGRRRGTSWIGAIVLLAGTVTVIGQATADAGGSSDDEAWRFGVFALVGAGVVLGAGALIARGLGEPVDGGEPQPPPALETSPDAPSDTPPDAPAPPTDQQPAPTAEEPAPVPPPSPVAWSAAPADEPAPDAPPVEDPPAATAEDGSAEPPAPDG